MSGLNMQRFVGGNVGVSSFARDVVTGRLTPHQMVSIEVALEQADSESRRDLADMLARVRTGQFTTREALANAERTIAALTRRAQLFEEDAVVVAGLEGALARRNASNPFYNADLEICLSPDQLFTEDRSVLGASAYVGDAGYSEPPAVDRADRGYRLSAASGVASGQAPTDSSLIRGAALTELARAGLAKIQSQILPVSGGTFDMGYNGADAFDWERPVHRVTVSKFGMGKNAVTNREYGEWVGSLGENRFFLVRTDPQTGWPIVMAMGTQTAIQEFKNAMSLEEVAQMMGEEVAARLTVGALETFLNSLETWEVNPHEPPQGFEHPDQPVVNVDWYSSYLYAFMHGGRLATSAEWEFAASEGGTRRLYDPQQIHTSHRRRQTTTAKVNDSTYADGAYGLRHLVGNAWEWTMDRWNVYTSEAETNPTGSVTGSTRVLRGVSWNGNDGGLLRPSNRNYDVPVVRIKYLGFRVVVPEDSKK